MRSSKTKPVAAATLLLVLFTTRAQGQTNNTTWWSDISERQALASGERSIIPAAYRTVRINGTALSALLEGATSGTIPEMDTKADRSIVLPMPDGTTARFRFMEASVMHPELQAQLPMIRTYAGYGICT